MHSLSSVQRRHVVRLAPAQNSGKSCEKVSERAGRPPRVWKLEWSRFRVPGGVQFNADVSPCRQGIDITLLNVGALGFPPPPVSQVQQLLTEERAAARQVGSSGGGRGRGGRTYLCWTSGALWGQASLRDTAERRRPPTPVSSSTCCPETPLSSKLFSRWRLSKRGADLRRCGPCSLRGSAIVGRQHPTRTGGKPGNQRLDGYTDSYV